MDQITLRIPVTVKSKVTQELKDKILNETSQILTDIDREMQNLEFQAKRMMAEQAKLDAQGLISLRAQVEEQKQRLANAKEKATNNWKSVPKFLKASWNRLSPLKSVTTLIS